jgi:exonuclease III
LETLKFDFDIIGITETHLNGVSEKLATLKDYNFVTNSRKCKNWGRVAIYLRPDLTYIHRTDIDVFEEGVFESIFVEVVDKGKSFHVGVIYRPPDSNMAQFSYLLNLVLDKLKDKRCYLMGDFNLDLSLSKTKFNK